jgi:hypothetical protein
VRLGRAPGLSRDARVRLQAGLRACFFASPAGLSSSFLLPFLNGRHVPVA